jgi:myo-inositol-1(or 4)-monophosphatase
MKRELMGIQAGICILYEAGGAAFGAKTKPLSGKVDADLLGTLF